jgi:hypothetical protein
MALGINNLDFSNMLIVFESLSNLGTELGIMVDI